MTEKEVFNVVVNNVCEMFPDLTSHEFKYEDRLADLGANSVDRADIVMASMEALSLNIPRVELFGVKNIGELAKLLYEKSQA